jgi:hypothetical protein
VKQPVFQLDFFYLILFCYFAAAAEGQVQLEPDVAHNTDTADTETTKISAS